MMTEFDIDKDGRISFDEYMTTMCGEGWTEDGACVCAASLIPNSH